MSTLALRAPTAPRLRSHGFGRLIKSVMTFLDVIAEAQQMAREAHKRFPFAAW